MCVCVSVCVCLKNYGAQKKEEHIWNSPCVEGPETAYNFHNPLL